MVVFIGVIAKVVPLQTASVIGLIAAKGLTKTVSVKVVPLQEAEAGVMR